MIRLSWKQTAVAAALAVAAPLATARAADRETGVAIANRMGTVVDDLGRKQTGEPVQTEQKGIVRDLDDLIASLEKECQNCRNGVKRNDPRNGMKDSEIKSGNGEMGALNGPADGGKDWTKLSDRERDRILQSMTEGFPPEYRTVLERYYRRLAEEKSAKAAGGATKADAPASAPAPAKP